MIRLALLAAFAAAEPGALPAGGQVIVFTQPGESRLDREFLARSLPEIEQMAEQLTLDLVLVDVSGGAPPEVGISPLIVFQNHRGRSIYQGRTTTLDRLRNFLRTSRLAPQGSGVDRRENVPVWKMGRSSAVAPLKITSLAGARPEGHDDAAFADSVRGWLAEGFERFRFQDQVEVGRSDRLFYFDLHPYLSEHDGRLYLSIEVYSQFHCKIPVFSGVQDPISGPWEERELVFAEAARALETATAAVIDSVEGGDGFTPLASDLAVKTWEELDLSLPPAPERTSAVETSVQLARAWRLRAPNPTDGPSLQFHFPAPLDSMRGEVREVAGELTLGEGLTFAGSEGRITAGAASVTMGDRDLDHTIRGEYYLNVEAHPEARFRLESFSLGAPALSFGELFVGVARGEFEMKGLTVPVEARLQIEAIVGEDDAPLLLVVGGFEIPLSEPFGMQGPGGPPRANTTLVFDFRFTLEPR